MALNEIETAFKRFDLITQRFIYELKKEFIYGKNVKRADKVQTNRNNDDTLREQKEHWPH